jgi:flagellar protein FlgJ
MDRLSGLARPGALPTPASARGVAGPLDPAELAKLKEAARGFEAIFIQQMLKGMRQPAGGLLAPGPGRQLYQDLADEELARSLSRRGGVGLADFLVRHLIRQGQKKGSSPASGAPMTQHKTTDLEGRRP